MNIAVQFENTVTLGALIQLFSFFAVGLVGFLAWRERSRTNTFLIAELKARLDRCEIEQMKERINIMWVFQLRRGLVEAELKGLGTENSPFRLTERANDLIQPILPRLKEFYAEINGDNLGVVELATQLEAQWGRQISDLICKKIAVSEAACIVVAIANLRPISAQILDEESACIRTETNKLKKLSDLPLLRDIKAGYRSLS